MTNEEVELVKSAKRYSRAVSKHNLEIKRRKELYGTAFRVTENEIEAEIQLGQALKDLKDKAMEV